MHDHQLFYRCLLLHNEYIYAAELKNLEASHNAIEIANEDQITSYYKIRQQLDNLSKQLLSYIQKPQHLLPFLQPGRLIKVCSLFLFLNSRINYVLVE